MYFEILRWDILEETWELIQGPWVRLRVTVGAWLCENNQNSHVEQETLILLLLFVCFLVISPLPNYLEVLNHVIQCFSLLKKGVAVGRWYVPSYLQMYFGLQSQHQMSDCGRYFCSSIWFFTDLQMLLYWWFWSCFWVSYFGMWIVWLFCPQKEFSFHLNYNNGDLDLH